MATNTPGTTARKNTEQQTGYLRFTVNWNDTVFNKQFLPAGAVILRTTPIIVTAFSAGVTLSAGIEAATYANLATSAQVAPTVAGQKAAVAPVAASTAAVPLAADSQVFALLGGTAATAGQAIFVVEYIPNNDL